MAGEIIAGLGPVSRFQLDELSVSYDDGRVLTFSEIPNSTYAQPTYKLEDWVQFSQNLGNGTFRFRGKIKEREHVGAIQQEHIQYTAYGIQRLANDCFIRDRNGRPEIYITPIATTLATTTYRLSDLYGSVFGSQTGTTQITTINAMTLAQGISALFGAMSTVLSSEGLPSKFSTAGLKNNPPTTLLNTVMLQGPFFNALQELTSAEPGLKAFFDENENQWKFVNIMQAPIVDVVINSDNVMEHNVHWSTADRYTAVRLFTRNDDPTLKNFRRPFTYKVNVEALPAWNTTLERSWTRQKGGTLVYSQTPSTQQEIQNFYTDPNLFVYGAVVQNQGVAANTYWHVFRTYYLNYNNGAPYRGTGFLTYYSPYYKGGAPLSIECDIVQGPFGGTLPQFLNHGLFAIAKEPIIIAGEGDAPGGAIGTNFTNSTTGAPFHADNIYSNVYATLEFENAQAFVIGNNVQELRYPTSGFEGNAFTFFGVKREKSVEVQREQLTQANAKSILSVYKDCIVSGEIPIEGPPLFEFMTLGKRIKLSHGSLTTALASIYGMVTSYRYNFGKRGTNSITYSTDYSGLIRNS